MTSATSPRGAALMPGEARRALLDERHRALDEVVAAGHLLLDLWPPARAARPSARTASCSAGAWCPRRSASGRRPCAPPARRPPRSSCSSATTRLIRPHSSAFARGQALAEHRQLARARHADARRQEQRGAAVGHEPDVDEREQEVGALGGQDQVAAERQRAADADGRAVDGRDHRLGHLADRVHDRVVALGQRLVDVRAALGRRVAAADVLQVGARGEARARRR